MIKLGDENKALHIKNPDAWDEMDCRPGSPDGSIETPLRIKILIEQRQRNTKKDDGSNPSSIIPASE